LTCWKPLCYAGHPATLCPGPLRQVNRLELLLSIASFAAALGAMVAGIFGMNLRSTLEMSVIGFWGTTAMIVLGSYWVSPRLACLQRLPARPLLRQRGADAVAATAAGGCVQAGALFSTPLAPHPQVFWIIYKYTRRKRIL
jgi:hypothetical protein